MTKVSGPKYRLLSKRRVMIDAIKTTKRLYQLEAVRDIPCYGVKAGDLGGYVSYANLLSQYDDCWIKEGSFVVGWKAPYSIIQDNALIDGEYYLNNTTVTGYSSISGGKGCLEFSNLKNNVTVVGNVDILHSELIGFINVEHKKDMNSSTNPFDLCEDRITLASCYLSNARISGYGDIHNVSSREEFEVMGTFDIDFDDIDSEKLVLNNSLKASGDTRIATLTVGNAPIQISGISDITECHIGNGNFMMNGGQVSNSLFQGFVDISGEVKIEKSRLTGNNTLRDKVVVKPNSNLQGTNILSGETVVPEGGSIFNQTLAGGLAVIVNNHMFSLETSVVMEDTDDEIESFRESIKSVEGDYEAYTTDIVKLIKYPAMADASVPETQELLVALRSSRRALKSNNRKVLERSSEALEKAFVKAENNAYILAASFMDDKRKQNLKKAGSALAIALDEKANEHERRAGYKSGMKSLEGVLPVSEKAVFALKERIGLKEIEA